MFDVAYRILAAVKEPALRYNIPNTCRVDRSSEYRQPSSLVLHVFCFRHDDALFSDTNGLDCWEQARHSLL